MLDGSFILATSAIHLITVVSACLLGLTKVKVTLNTFIHPSHIQGRQNDELMRLLNHGCINI